MLSNITAMSGSAIKSFNKFLRFDAKEAAWIILQAAATNQRRCLIGNDAKMMDIVQRLSPNHYITILHRMSKLSRKLKPSRRVKTTTDKPTSSL